MSDMQDKEPPQRCFERRTKANSEGELRAWPYSSIKSENVISRKLIYGVQADNFHGALRIATLLRDTVRAMHDIWVCEIVRIEEGRI